MSNLLAAASNAIVALELAKAVLPLEGQEYATADQASEDLHAELKNTRIKVGEIMKLVERHRISGGREEHQATKEMLEDAIARVVSGTVKDDLFDRSDK